MLISNAVVRVNRGQTTFFVSMSPSIRGMRYRGVKRILAVGIHTLGYLRDKGRIFYLLLKNEHPKRMPTLFYVKTHLDLCVFVCIS